MRTPQYGDYQWDIYPPGLQGKLPKYPIGYPSLERAAADVLPSLYSYVGYCAGDGHMQSPTWLTMTNDTDVVAHHASIVLGGSHE